LLPVRNIRQRPGSFAVSQFEYRRALRQARDQGLDLVALYHTHATGPISLSPRDRESIARSTLPWVVVAGKTEANHPNTHLQWAAFSAGIGTPLTVSWVERD
jgi:proteasome lid subunit RPN8/RPN11